MAQDTSHRIPITPFSRSGGFSIFVYGLSLLVVVISLYGFLAPDQMLFFKGDRGFFLLPLLLAIVFLVSEISRQGKIRKLNERIRKLEKDMRLSEAEKRK